MKSSSIQFYTSKIYKEIHKAIAPFLTLPHMGLLSDPQSWGGEVLPIFSRKLYNCIQDQILGGHYAPHVR